MKLEQALLERDLDFTGAFMATNELVSAIHMAPDMVSFTTKEALEHTLTSPVHRRQKQSLFLYKAAAEGLASLASSAGVPQAVAMSAVETLKKISCADMPGPQQAAAEALGSLHLDIRGPALKPPPMLETPMLDWEGLQARAGIRSDVPLYVYGRSLAAKANGREELLVVKLLGAEDDPSCLQWEVAWMNHLRTISHLQAAFRVPRPLDLGGCYIFRLDRLPEKVNGSFSRPLHRDRLAIAYKTQSDYFVYVNGHRDDTGMDEAGLLRVLGHCACLLGQLTSMGIVHLAPIPLFHNRIQTHRRADGGLYQWSRGGRLDRWLHSCQYPNLGLTGIRDFEHFISWSGRTAQLYEHIGTHLLSLVLVAGSYFRNQRPGYFGRNADGTTVDARDLFIQRGFRELIEGLFQRYYTGFVGHSPAHDTMASLDLDRLSQRLVDELGMDRYMEEVFRVVDQQQMSEEEFLAFLVDRGLSAEQASNMQRGVEDITLLTGPHLGRFNDRISVPELIQCVSAVSALCVADRFLMERSTQTTIGMMRPR